MREKRKYDKKDKDRKPRKIRVRAPVLTPDIKIDYKNIELLHKVMAPNGRILSQRFTGATCKQQRELTQAIKRAKYLSLVPVGSSRKRF